MIEGKEFMEQFNARYANFMEFESQRIETNICGRKTTIGAVIGVPEDHIPKKYGTGSWVWRGLGLLSAVSTGGLSILAGEYLAKESKVLDKEQLKFKEEAGVHLENGLKSNWGKIREMISNAITQDERLDNHKYGYFEISDLGVGVSVLILWVAEPVLDR